DGKKPAAAATAMADGQETNLLPNDTEAVFSVNIGAAMDSSLKQAVFQSEGGFRPQTFKDKLGIDLKETARVIVALNSSNKWSFNVVRTKSAYDAEAVKKALGVTDKGKVTRGPSKLDYFILGPNDLLDGL